MIATKRSCPPFRPAGSGTTSNHWRDNSTPSPLEQAKGAVNIFDLWRHFQYAGDPERQKKVCSPFRPDRHPTLCVSRDGQLWNDFGSDAGGDVVAFVMQATGLSLSDAAKWLIEYAGTGRNRASVTIVTTAPCHAPEPEQRPKPTLPAMQRGDLKRLQVLASFRKLPPEGLQLADGRGLLHFALLKNLSAWLVTDSERVNCQARRMDGGLWPHLEAKAWTWPGCWATWPIGINEAQPFPMIALVEGAPDLLAAHHFICAEKREGDVAAVCITGASMRIHESALPLFNGKRVRIYPHLDDAGQKAAERWTAQLESVNAEVDCYDLSGIPKTDGQPAKDLNDLTSLSMDVFDPELFEVLP